MCVLCKVIVELLTLAARYRRGGAGGGLRVGMTLILSFYSNYNEAYIFYISAKFGKVNLMIVCVCTNLSRTLKTFQFFCKVYLKTQTNLLNYPQGLLEKTFFSLFLLRILANSWSELFANSRRAHVLKVL